MPFGLLIVLDNPGPFKVPEVHVPVPEQVPTIVDTVYCGIPLEEVKVILLMALLVSLIKAYEPSDEIVQPFKTLNAATVPTPSTLLLDPVPAMISAVFEVELKNILYNRFEV
jgi:hypothetical protein